MGRRDRSDSLESQDNNDDRKRRRKRDRKSSRKRSRSPKRRRREEEDGDESDSYDSDAKNHFSSSSRKRRRDDESRKDESNEKNRHRRSSTKENSSSSSSSAASDESDDDRSVDSGRRRRKKDSKKKRRKDDKKKKKKKSSKHDKKKKSSNKRKREEGKRKKKSRRDNDDSTDEEEDQNDSAARMKEFERNYALAEALHELLLEHPTPAMAKDTLPLVLLKLGGGTSLDLRQMPDRSAAQGIQRVLKALQPFGVGEEEPQVWKWTVPGGGRGGDERFLLRIVRTLLNDIGFTMDAITQTNQEVEDTKPIAADKDAENMKNGDSEGDTIRDQTVKLLQSFQQKSKAAFTLPGELGGLCKMLFEGENVALDGLPDANLRGSLEGLFQQCGLELQEMEEDESDSDDAEVQDNNQSNKELSMGYGLPETPEQERLVQTRLLSVMKACETIASAPPAAAAATTKRGPMPMPAGYQAPEESSDEEGPAPVGAAKRKEPPPVSKEVIKLQAEMRACQLRGAVTGQETLLSADVNTREEWMLDPGKFDFLSSIKAGNPMKSRNFQAKSKGGSGTESSNSTKVMDPKIKAEMDAIMQAHTDVRGPTLVEQHRLKKKQEKEAKAAAGGKKGQWKWNRDKDLDSGRRVDKDALHQVLGGASEDLKKKFQGGF